MTLVIATSGSGTFVAMSSDTREVMKIYMQDTEIGSLEDTDLPVAQVNRRNEKVIRLSDFVLIGIGGSSDLARYVLEELPNMVKPGYELKGCAMALQCLVEHIRQHQDETFKQFINRENGITIIMNGFLQDGATGLATFQAGPDSEVLLYREEYGLRGYALIPPVEKYVLGAAELLDISGQDFNDPYSWTRANLDIMRAAHASIAEDEPVRVSSEGVMHLIELNPGGTVKYTKEDF